MSAKFELEKKEASLIKAKMDENLIFRKERQPNLALPNAGSVFKNPKDSEFSAGALIDKCGLRGFRIGDCEVWENHCNFIINKGNATFLDMIELINLIKKESLEKYNINLECEWEIIE